MTALFHHSHLNSFADHPNPPQTEHTTNQPGDVSKQTRGEAPPVDSVGLSPTILAWEELTPCQSYDADLWFAEQSADLERAKELCQLCPLAAACLAAALERAEPWGVWGGQIFTDGQIVASKRGRGRPRKNVAA